MTATSWTLTLGDNPPLRLVDLAPAHGPGARDVIVAGWTFGPGPWVPAPRSYPATLECHDGPVVVERITGEAWSTWTASVIKRGPRFCFRFVSDLDVDV